MSRQRVALLFVVYFIVSVAIPVVTVALAMPSEVSISRMTPRGFIGAAIALGIKIYFVSGALPFAVWGARGFKGGERAKPVHTVGHPYSFGFCYDNKRRGGSDHWLACALNRPLFHCKKLFDWGPSGSLSES